MVKKKSGIFENFVLNLINDKSGKKSYNGVLIIAAVLGILVLSGLVIGVGIGTGSGDAENLITVYNGTTIAGKTGSGTGNMLLFEDKFAEFNVSVVMIPTMVALSNISLNVTFDKSFSIISYNFSSGTGNNSFMNNSLHGNTYAWRNATNATGGNSTGYSGGATGTTNAFLGNTSTTNSSFLFRVIPNTPGKYNITVILTNGTRENASEGGVTGGTSILNFTLTQIGTNESNITIWVNDTTAPNYITLNTNSTGVGSSRSVDPILSLATKPATTRVVNLSTNTVSATTIYVDVNITDFNETGSGGIGYAGQRIANLTMILYNDTDVVNTTNGAGGIANGTLFVPAGNRTENATQSLAFNFSKHTGGWNLTEGRYLIVIKNFSDAGGNNNATALAYNITIDSTSPTVSAAKSSSSTQHKLVYDITVSDGLSGINGKQCTVTSTSSEAVSISGNTGTQTVTQENLGCGTSYTFTNTCTDHSGNQRSLETSFSTDSCAGGSSSGTSGGTSTSVGSTTSDAWTVTYNEATTNLVDDSDGVTSNLGEGGRVKVKIDSTLYYVGVKETTDTTATIAVSTSTEDKEATLNIGDVGKFDVNADNIYDLAVTLSSIDTATGKAELKVVYIQEEVPAVEEEEVSEEVGEAAAAAAGKGKAWLWIVIGIVALAVIIGVIVSLQKKKRFKNYGF